ncbi:MAG: radical SAM protein [Acidobacteriota bacterium]
MDKHLLIHKFKTKNGNQYVYDAWTNNTYAVNDIEIFLIENYSLLHNPEFKKGLKNKYPNYDIDNSIKEVSSWINVDNAFIPKNFQLMNFYTKEQYCKEVNNLGQMILEVTERCNLICKYCYRNEFTKKRTSPLKDMEWEIAKKSIDYYINKINSPDRTKVKGFASLSFYGGEPLLNIKLIKKCLNYINNLDFDDSITYHITTNGTIINKEIADLLEKHGIQLLISLETAYSDESGH